MRGMGAFVQSVRGRTAARARVSAFTRATHEEWAFWKGQASFRPNTRPEGRVLDINRREGR